MPADTPRFGLDKVRDADETADTDKYGEQMGVTTYPLGLACRRRGVLATLDQGLAALPLKATAC